jgi:hypothetical protein
MTLDDRPLEGIAPKVCELVTLPCRRCGGAHLGHQRAGAITEEEFQRKRRDPLDRL